MSEKELEERVLISKKQFLELKKHIQEQYPNYVLIEQRNLYLDDVSFGVRKNRNMLRIRSFAHSKMKEFTYKIKGQDGDTEINQPLTYYWYRQITHYSHLPEGEVKDVLVEQNIDINSIRPLASLWTRRMEVELDEYTIVLDQNRYNHIIDYNLEIESKLSKSHAKEVILQFCERFGLEYKNDYPSKSRRLFSSLAK